MFKERKGKICVTPTKWIQRKRDGGGGDSFRKRNESLKDLNVLFLKDLDHVLTQAPWVSVHSSPL